MSTRPWIVDDELWALIEPLLPPWPERTRGPRPVSDRLCLQDILYVLYNDTAMQLLPLESGFGSGRDVLAPAGPAPEGRCLRPAAPESARVREFLSPLESQPAPRITVAATGRSGFLAALRPASSSRSKTACHLLAD
ncbi:transposase [Streptomyces sp. DfronAA-171]|uniref:transposase n=1 Tax=Streptomyces sp. DfronAA-171 TaxID=1839777 RepID=UPI000B8635C6